MITENYINRAIQLGTDTFGGVGKGACVNVEALDRLARDYALLAQGYNLDGDTVENLPPVPADELEQVKVGLLKQIGFTLS